MIGSGTTPTIRFNLKVIDPADIAYAVMTIAKCGAILVEKETDTATFGESYIEWNLSQQETLELGQNGEVEIQARYRMNNEQAYKSPCHTVKVDKLLHEGVI